MAEFIDAPEEDKAETPNGNSKRMYFRYDTATGKCAYRGVNITSPHEEPDYKSFANIGYQKDHRGLGLSDVSKWDENTKSQVVGDGRTTYNVTGVLTDRVYRY